MTFKKNQIVTCSHDFQVKIINIDKNDDLIEFMVLSTQKKYLLPIDRFEKMIKTLH